MLDILRNFTWNSLSFWLGFLAGLIFLWFLLKVRYIVERERQKLRAWIDEARTGLAAGLVSQLRAEALRSAQRMHLAAPLFSLDEILIEPRLQSPSPLVGARTNSLSTGRAPGDVASLTLPYLPDWPELAARYGGPTLTLAQALHGGANLAIIGRPGSGKTVALAHLACQISRRDPELQALADCVPIFLHAADLRLKNQASGNPIDLLIAHLSARVSTLVRSRVPGFLRSAFEQGRALLLLDGLDEYPPDSIEETVAYLGSLMRKYPALRVVASASTDSYDGLTSLGLVPLSMAAWTERQRNAFLTQWSELFTRYLKQPKQKKVDPQILFGWLLHDESTISPLEYTLKIWAAFAGDSLGRGVSEALEAYIRRMTVSIPKGRQALEKLALHVVVSRLTVMKFKEVQGRLSEFDPQAQRRVDSPSPRPAKLNQIPILRVLPYLVENGLLVKRLDSSLTFSHPTICGYLAASALAKSEEGKAIIDQPEWVGKSLTLEFLASLGDVSSLVKTYLTRKDSPLLEGPLTVARWLRRAPSDAPWRAAALRTVANLLSDENLPFGLRARFLTALATSGDSEVNGFFRQMLNSTQVDARRLGVLGCGFKCDRTTIGDLRKMLNDPALDVCQSACLALVAVGELPALELVASALLYGSEELRRAAAEALADHPEEGHTTLKDGSTVEDFLVRRAVIYGLTRIRQPWTIEILENMRLQDSQWVVRNAANQALEEIVRPDPRTPHPFPPLSETPWLIAFAGQRGMGVVPGKPARELLIQALKEGKEEQRLAALDYLHQFPNPDTIPGIYALLSGSSPHLREAALNTLWHMSAAGLPLPSYKYSTSKSEQ